MKQLKHYTIAGALFVLILGTISHFLYQWLNQNFFIGLFTPVNESPWEHMKLVFFPMLFYSLFAGRRLHQNYPCIASALCAGILLATFCIPVIFFTYTGIIGHDIFILDLITFIVSVLLGFYAAYRLAVCCKAEKYTGLLCCLVCIMVVCFMWFSYHPANIGIFLTPTPPAN
jgi:hypothetical protein